MLKSWNPPEIPEKEEISLRLDKARGKLYELQMKIKEHKVPVLVLFEGWSSAGKGSMIGKVIRNIDPRFFKVATMAAPTEDERRRPFLYPVYASDTGAGEIYLPGFRMDGRDHESSAGRRAVRRGL